MQAPGNRNRYPDGESEQNQAGTTDRVVTSGLLGSEQDLSRLARVSLSRGWAGRLRYGASRSVSQCTFKAGESLLYHAKSVDTQSYPIMDNSVLCRCLVGFRPDVA